MSTVRATSTPAVRPADLATFLLASGEMLPRQRARDQQADLAGLELKRRVLDLIVSYDPEPAELELCLARIVDELGPPSGPTRAICATLRDEWAMATITPGLIDWLLDEALRAGAGEHRGKRRGKARE